MHRVAGCALMPSVAAIVVAVLVGAFAAATTAQQPNAVDAAAAPDVATITVNIEAIDLANRVVAVKGPLGRVVALKVDDRVRNLARVKAGDQIVLKYAEAVSLAVAKSGASATTAPGAKPAVATARQIRVAARVEALDAARQVVLLEGPGGRCAEVKVRDAGVFGSLATGDNVEIAYTEAMVVGIVAPKK
jgi:hypothetical protein